MLITIIILVLSAVFFVNGKIRSDLVALCALVALLIFQILTPDEALSGFSNSVVIMMVGLFVVGGAIFQTGLAKMISSHILKLAGKSELKLFLLVMLVTSAIGAFVSNTGTVALMLPIVVSLAVSANMNPSRLLMPLAFASSMGGMMTLIGTPPNLVIQNALTSAGFPPLSFFSFFPVGIICVAVGTLVLLPLSKWFLSKRGKNGDDNVHSGKSLKQLVKEYGLSSNLFRLRVVGDSRLHGKTIIELDIRRKYGLNILEVRRGDMSQHSVLVTVGVSKQLAADLGVAAGLALFALFHDDHLGTVVGSSLGCYHTGCAHAHDHHVILGIPADSVCKRKLLLFGRCSRAGSGSCRAAGTGSTTSQNPYGTQTQSTLDKALARDLFHDVFSLFFFFFSKRVKHGLLIHKPFIICIIMQKSCFCKSFLLYYLLDQTYRSTFHDHSSAAELFSRC